MSEGSETEPEEELVPCPKCGGSASTNSEWRPQAYCHECESWVVVTWSDN